MKPLTSTSCCRLVLIFLRSPRTDHLPSGYFSGIFDCAQEGCGGRSTLMGGSSCASTPAAPTAMTPRNAPDSNRFIIARFITLALLVQGCGGSGKREAGGRFADAEAGAFEAPPHRSGTLRVMIDAEPQGDNDLWGSRIARLCGDPVLPGAATVDSETPDHLYLRPREGVSARDLGAALDAAQKRLPDVDRIEVGGSIVRLYLRRPSTRLQKTLAEVMVPGTGPFKQVRKGVLERVRGAGVPAIEFIV